MYQEEFWNQRDVQVDFVHFFKFAHLQVRFYIWDLGNAESDV